MRCILQVSLLFAALLWLMSPAFGQHATRVFASKPDSSAFYENEALLFSLDPRPANDHFRDSVIAVQQMFLQNSFIGWKYDYEPSPEYVPYDALVNHKINLAEVKKLSISNREHRLPGLVFQCVNLEELELLNTHLARIPRRLNRLGRLNSLRICNNQSAGKLRLGNNAHVTSLAIRSDQPGKCPTKFRKFSALDSLDLARNFLVSFPRIAQNTRLRKLILSENSLTLEGLRVKRNESLQLLYLRKNKIQVVPDAVGNFAGLKDLSLNHNQIRKVEDGIRNLHHLEELSFYQNKLTAIPGGIFDLTGLREIDFYFNEIERLDSQIVNLKNLEILYLANNCLYSLPENLGDLPRVQELYLHHNRISYFPTSIGNLAALKILRFNDNFFAEFPEQLTKLSNLENMDFSRNRIQWLPSDVGAYPKLKLLVMTENPWDDPDAILALAGILRAKGTTVLLDSGEEKQGDAGQR